MWLAVITKKSSAKKCTFSKKMKKLSVVLEKLTLSSS